LLKLMLLLALAAPPSLDIPAEIKSDEQYIRFTPKSDAKSIVYIGLSGLAPFPNEECKDSLRFLLPTQGVKAGRYRFAAIAASGTGEQVRKDFTVVFGESPPAPVDPFDPLPVDPPAPDPIDAKDPLRIAIQTAYNLEVSKTKDEDRIKLAAYYREAAKMATDTTLDTWEKMFQALAAKSKEMAGDPLKVLTGVRRSIQTYLRQDLPIDPMKPILPGTPARANLIKNLNKIALVLEVTK
jgi:hypothetical protein